MHVEEAKKKPAKEICLSKNLKYKKFLSHSDNEVSNFNALLCDGWNNKALISDNLSGESSFSLSNELHIPSYVRKSSLRKRIIHLLALRPYNKCELLRLLKRHGISENDKKSFEFKLSEVSTCYKRQRFTLTIPAWKEVDAAWPYYRVEQRQLVRRRLNAMYRGTSDRLEEHFHSTDFEFLEKKPTSNNGLQTLNLNNKQKFLQSALCPEPKHIRRFKERCHPNVLEDVEKHYHSISDIQSSFHLHKNMRIPISETIESKQKPWSFATLACLVMAEDNSVVELRLGASFDPNPRVAFHSVRYDFKPASVDVTKEAALEVGEKNQVTITVPHIESSGTTHTVYKGNKRTCPKECVLIIDNASGSVTLEKLSNTIQVKKTRAEGSSRLSMRPLTPVDSSKMKTSPPKSGKMSQHSPSSFKECSPALTPVEPDNNRDNGNSSLNVCAPVALTNNMSESSSSSSSSSGSDVSSDSESDNSDSEGGPNKDTPAPCDVPSKDLSTLSEDLHLTESGSDSE
ncbi:ELL-associated factor 1-like isoform X2 [Octopus vulgaris]|uniref:ELL-associated factor 1-like isoform X2 n=1 Tax=Octopus vulgaris TaxID=6645 RepID=A0AA36AKM4_OCTVU|nr:ELL-associated factor 1-like isoform X2 [Octopus vulgaris]